MKCPNCTNEMVESRAGWLCLACGRLVSGPLAAEASTEINKEAGAGMRPDPDKVAEDKSSSEETRESEPPAGAPPVSPAQTDPEPKNESSLPAASGSDIDDNDRHNDADQAKSAGVTSDVEPGEPAVSPTADMTESEQATKVEVPVKTEVTADNSDDNSANTQETAAETLPPNPTPSLEAPEDPVVPPLPPSPAEADNTEKQVEEPPAEGSAPALQSVEKALAQVDEAKPLEPTPAAAEPAPSDDEPSAELVNPAPPASSAPAGGPDHETPIQDSVTKAPFTPATQPRRVNAVIKAGATSVIAVIALGASAVWLYHPPKLASNLSGARASNALDTTSAAAAAGTSRDAEREADLAVFLSAYKAAVPTGSFPTTPPAVKVMRLDPTTGQAYIISTATPAAVGQIQYAAGANCAKMPASNSPRDPRALALTTKLESGAPYCLGTEVR